MGPLIGTRTWGGWVGIRGGRKTIDNGGNTQPEFSGWGAFDGKWLIEGPGVYPDEEVVDDPALGQIGLGDLDWGFAALVVIFGDEIVFDLNVFFLGHLFTPRLRALLAHLIAANLEAVKKFFSIVQPAFSLSAQSSDVLCLYSQRSSIRQLPHCGLRALQT